MRLVKGRIREPRAKFRQTPAFTEPVHAHQGWPRPDSGEEPGVLGTGLGSGLFWEAGLSERLPGESLLEQAGLGAIALPDLCPLPQIIPTEYLSSECPWIAL